MCINIVRRVIISVQGIGRRERKARHERPRKPVDLRQGTAVFRGPGRLEHRRAATGMARCTPPPDSPSIPEPLGLRALAPALAQVGKSGSSSPLPLFPCPIRYHTDCRSRSHEWDALLETRLLSFLEPLTHRDSPMTNPGSITTRWGEISSPSVPSFLIPLRLIRGSRNPPTRAVWPCPCDRRGDSVT